METAKNVVSAFLNPIKSFQALKAWAKENPWKCGAIAVGGLCLGVVAFGGAAVLVDMFLIDFTSKAALALFLQAGGIGGVIVPLSVAANRSKKLIERAKDEESQLKEKFDFFKRDLKERGEKITEQALNDGSNDWWTLLDGVNTERQAADEINQQIETMNVEQLQETESALMEYLPKIEDGLRCTIEDINVATGRTSHIQEKSSVLHRAADIMRRRIFAAATSDDDE